MFAEYAGMEGRGRFFVGATILWKSVKQILRKTKNSAESAEIFWSGWNKN